MTTDAPLDRFVWQALTGRQAACGEGDDRARRYRPEFTPFAGTRDDSPNALAALADILPPAGRAVLVTRDALDPPPALTVLHRASVAQMVLPREALPSGLPCLPATTRRLGAADVPAILALVALTQPGPFAARTIELGAYFGVFAGEALVAMTGERICFDGFTEVSAVCTHPDHRGKGLAAALIGAVASAAMARNETPYLHAFASNESAIALYRRLGFVTRASFHLAALGRADDAAER